MVDTHFFLASVLSFRRAFVSCSFLFSPSTVRECSSICLPERPPGAPPRARAKKEGERGRASSFSLFDAHRFHRIDSAHLFLFPSLPHSTSRKQTSNHLSHGGDRRRRRQQRVDAQRGLRAHAVPGKRHSFSFFFEVALLHGVLLFPSPRFIISRGSSSSSIFRVAGVEARSSLWPARRGKEALQRGQESEAREWEEASFLRVAFPLRRSRVVATVFSFFLPCTQPPLPPSSSSPSLSANHHLHLNRPRPTPSTCWRGPRPRPTRRTPSAS